MSAFPTTQSSVLEFNECPKDAYRNIPCSSDIDIAIVMIHLDQRESTALSRVHEPLLRVANTILVIGNQLKS
jgi:hypothetical protein